MVSHHPAKFGFHRHGGSGDMFLVDEKEDSRCSGFNPPLLLRHKSTWHKSTWNIIVITPILVTRA